MKKNTFLILSILAIISLELVVLTSSKKISQNNVLTKSDISPVPDNLSGLKLLAEKDRLSQRIDEIGAEKAYQEFKSQYQNKDFGVQHLGAHIIGALLYQKKGLQGQTICDSTFSFGCYHSFFAQALSNNGTFIIVKLNQLCLDKFGPLGTGCQHGIGHGVMDYYGPDHILDALYGCKPTTATSEISGCTSGVFMEYNVPVLVTDSGASATSRPLDPKKPYEPCPSLPQGFQESCYYSIGQWWDQTDYYRGNWKSQGLLCKNIPDQSYMETCYLGIGNVTAPNNNFEPDKAIASCENMPDRQSIVICRAGAFWSFAANVQFQPLAVKMCEGLNPVEKKDCLHRGNMLNPSNQ